MTQFELFTQSNHSTAHWVTPLLCDAQIQKWPVDSAMVLFGMISLVKQKIHKVSHDMQMNSKIKTATSLLYNSSITNMLILCNKNPAWILGWFMLVRASIVLIFWRPANQAGPSMQNTLCIYPSRNAGFSSRELNTQYWHFRFIYKNIYSELMM